MIDQCFSTRHDFAPQETCDISGDIFGYWHLVGREQHHAIHPTMYRPSQLRIIWPQMSRVPRLGIPTIDDTWYALGLKLYMSTALTSVILISIYINNINTESILIAMLMS